MRWVLSFTFLLFWGISSSAKPKRSQVRKITCCWCRVWQCQDPWYSQQVSWLPLFWKGWENQTTGQHGENIPACLSPDSEGMCSILSLLTDPSLGTKTLKVCEAEFGETSQTQKRWGGGEDHRLSNSLTQSPANTQQLHYAMQSQFFTPVLLCCVPSVLLLLLLQFGVAFPHSYWRVPAWWTTVEELTPLLAALKAAKLIFQTSSNPRTWGYFPFLSAFSLLVKFSAAQSPSFSPQACFSFPVTQFQSLQPPFWEGKRENKAIRISFHKFMKNKLIYQVSGTKTTHI